MREFSAHGDIVSLERARWLVIARLAGDPEYSDVQASVFAEFDDLSPKDRGAAVIDLINALVQMSSVMAFKASDSFFTPEDMIDVVYEDLAGGSNEHAPDRLS